MHRDPVPADPGMVPGPAGEPVITCPDPLSEEEWLACADASAAEGEPWWLPGDAPEPEDADWAEIEACAREAAGDQEVPGEHTGRAAQFASGMLFDVAPGCAGLAAFADQATGPDDDFAGVSDNELAGVLGAWGRIESHAAARKYAAVAELIRRRPARGCAPEGPARLPREWDEFAAVELTVALAVSRGDAAAILGLACDLEARLPGTRAALRDGTITLEKAGIIAWATAVLDDAEARQAEDLVLGRAGNLTPGGLRSAIARAVIQVNPDKARKRRERAAREARVERWAEASGNAGLAGRELPPAAVLAADQKITAWAEQLRTAGLEGGLDELRARAYLDLLLGTDSRPPDPAAAASPGSQGGSVSVPSGGPAGVLPAGFVGRVNLIVPLATLLGLAGRPGELPGLGPIDPGLATDLARAAAASPKTTWCVTVTDQHGHAIGHGCARPQPKSHSRRPETRGRPGSPGGPGPPRGATPAPSGFTFTAADPPGSDGGYGTWRLTTGTGGPGLTVTLDRIATDPCDHRYQARGHDPGAKLRHLTQVRHATCTGPGCRRPAERADFEHNTPYEAGGSTCLCNGGPKCRFDHRMKQDPRWKAEQRPDGTFVWITPSGRQHETEPTRYPV